MIEKKLRRMLDADVLRVAEAFVWAAKQAPYDEQSNILDSILRKRERDRDRRILQKTLPGVDITGMLPPKEKTGRKNRLKQLEWELTELFQYSGLDQKDSAWCVVAILRVHGLANPYQRPNIAGRASQRPSAVPKRCEATERKLQKSRAAVDVAQAAFLATSDEAAFENLNAAWEKYLALRKLAEHKHVASSIKLLQRLRYKNGVKN